MQQWTRTGLLRYGASVIAVGLALGVKFLLIGIVTQDSPFLLFFTAVMVAAWIGGLGPGILATILAALCNLYFFMEPFERFTIANPGQSAQLLLFMFECFCISLICSKWQAARRHAEAANEEARELERRIIEIDDAEQRRIGHDLHDGLGQHLTGIALMTRRLEQRLAVEQSKHSQAAAEIAGLARTAIEWTHDLSNALSPPALEREGLNDALQQLCANAERLFEIECTFELKGDETPFRDVQAGAHLYRIAQEAISNAVKHGKAKHVRLLLSSASGHVLIQIADDGNPAPASQTAPASNHEGMGLRIMRYRAGMIGASLNVEHRQNGTTVACRYQPAQKMNGNGESHHGDE